MFYYTHIEYFKSRFQPNTLHSLFTALLTSVSHYELQYNIFHVPLVQQPETRLFSPLPLYGEPLHRLLIHQTQQLPSYIYHNIVHIYTLLILAEQQTEHVSLHQLVKGFTLNSLSGKSRVRTRWEIRSQGILPNKNGRVLVENYETTFNWYQKLLYRSFQIRTI